MRTTPRPDIGTLVIVQSVEEGGSIAVELACGCVLVYGRWLRDAKAAPPRISDILLVTKANADAVLVELPGSGVPPYFLYGAPTVKLACEAHARPKMGAG